ncbi:MAG: T9SS type A sorting domain-containing protein [Paludibacter sp.]
MKKTTSLIAAFLVAMSVSAAVIVETNWQLSAATVPSTIPVWVGTGNLCRGLAYGKMGANERVFVISREGGNLVHILNASTGADLGTLPMGTDVVTGSYFVINDAGMTSDGVLLVGSMALANGEFKVYRWDTETSTPTLAISYPAALGRMGDKITVVGSITTGTARVYASTASAVDGKTKIYYFDMEADAANPGKYKFVQTPKTLASVTTCTSNPAIGLKSNGDFYFKGGGTQISSYTSAGVLGTESSSTIVGSSGNTPRYIGKDALNNEYICYFRNGATKEKLNILKLPNGDLSLATVVDSTAALGVNANGNGTSGVVVNVLPNNDVELFVLSTNNGIGKYTVKGLFTSTGLNDLSNNNVNVIYLKSTISVEGTRVSSIELYNSLGQKVKSVLNSNELKTDNLKGVYIVQIKAEGKIVKTTKVSIR